jgi:2-amino-4-hydroxy-6-hydroxymethyldihydropteridine diphosphokinase
VTLAYVGLGANLGAREETLRHAVEQLGEAEGVDVLAVSSLRETEPVGVVGQPPFLNGVVQLETSLPPRELLDLLLAIERSLGRVRGARWGPRLVDLDLLLYGGEIVDEPGLRIPHPRLHERRFALEPLAELDPGLAIPGRASVSARLAELD